MHFSSPARILLLSFALLLSFGAMGQDSSQSDKEHYRRSIEKADSCFEEEAYGLAMEAYRKALEIHPNKEHPQKRIGKIESILSRSEEEDSASEPSASGGKNDGTEREGVEKDSVDKVWKVVEQEPKFPGGDQEMMEFIQENVSYPDTAREAGIEGKVYVGFIVEEDGSLSEIRVLNDVHWSLAEEAKRVIGKMPRWEPGTQKGRKVRVKVKVPILFRLD